MPADWIWGLIGGLMIGGAAALYLLVAGRVMGASGIVGGLLQNAGSNLWQERAVFIAGLAGVPMIYGLLNGFPTTNLTSNWVLLLIAGLIVGFGTRMANGCTSGHGVCGISRFSTRGIVATLTYLGFGFAAMALFRHGLGIV
ncbi:MAG: YeeE/YedE family protein [Pseudomonadota bacterium]